MARVAIVTGSDSGIGRAAAVRLARDGCDVGVTWHHDEQGARETAEEVGSYGRRAEVRRTDVSSIDDAIALVDELAGALGGLDVFVNINSVAPGEISTPMTGQPDTDPHTQERPGVPAGRPGDAREIAAAIAYLCSPDASYTTGASFVVDGGMLLMAAMANQLAS